MKISIDKKELLELLANQVKVNRKDLPILNCVLFHAEKDEGYLSVTSTDLDIQVKKHTQDVRVLEEGDAAIPLSELSKIAKKMGTCEIEIESYSKDGSYVKITAGGVTHVLEAFNADYFPCSITGEKLPDLKVTITSKVLCELIRRAKFAKAKDDTREVLLGCCKDDRRELSKVDRFSQKNSEPTDNFRCGQKSLVVKTTADTGRKRQLL